MMNCNIYLLFDTWRLKSMTWTMRKRSSWITSKIILKCTHGPWYRRNTYTERIQHVVVEILSQTRRNPKKINRTPAPSVGAIYITTVNLCVVFPTLIYMTLGEATAWRMMPVLMQNLMRTKNHSIVNGKKNNICALFLFLLTWAWKIVTFIC